ncbi:MAG: DUF3084 domain-containing protein [Cyanothece sp. SIO1E1]|nr:DUF3084 domain-containing protein [Cyanothece sp. SIO1E1]
MITGYLLVAALLVLGGVIATVGDRIGMRVGKARLTLFKLRPRQTATVVSILTGGIISASTLAIIFGTSDQLRTGVFELGKIQADLSKSRRELDQIKQDKQEIETELDEANQEQVEAQRRLKQINRSLKDARARQESTEAQLNDTQAQLQSVSQQAQQLRGEIGQLQSERRDLLRRQAQIKQQIAQRDRDISQRDRDIAKRDRDIAQRNVAIAERETRLKELESQQSFLAQEVKRLEQEAKGLREGNVALTRNQVLAGGVLRIVEPEAAIQAVDQILQEANRVALQRTLPGTAKIDEQVIRITNTEVNQLINQINDGQDYVVQILSAANYIVGDPCVVNLEEPCIQVFPVAVLNRIIFETGEIIATAAIDPTTDPTSATERGLRQRLNLLITASQFQARRSGVVTDSIQIADGRTETWIRFLEQAKQFNQPIAFQAVAAEAIYAAGPVRIELVAVQNGQILFRTG